MSGFFIDFLIATRNLLQHTKRTVLLGGAIAVLTALLVLLNGLSAGVRETILKTATTLITGHVNVAGFYKPTAGQSAPVVVDYQKAREILDKTVPNVDLVVERGRGWAAIVSETGTTQAGLSGINIEREPRLREVITVMEGTLDELAKPNSALIFEDQAKRLGVKVGDAVTISAQTPRGVNNTLDVRIVAIGKELGFITKFNIFLHAPSLRALYDLKDNTTGALQIYISDPKRIPKIAADLRNAFKAANYRVMEPTAEPFWMKFPKVNREDWTGQGIDITTYEDELAFFTWAIKLIDGITALLIGILLVIVVIGIMNTMWIAIRERTREIGTLRAIGMQRGRVLWMFLLEAVILGLAGTFVGAALGGVLAFAINRAGVKLPPGVQFITMSDRLWVFIMPASVVGSVLFITIVTSLAALYPSYRAARLRPITAMHHVG